MKFGFQGDWGSNCESATNEIVKNINKEVELMPLISSKNVVSALKNGEIDFGVMAIENNIGGIVKETQNALNEDIELVKKFQIEIHHCLFVKDKQIDKTDIKFVASHEQALFQTKTNLNRIFKDIRLVKIADTALGAKYLSNGKFAKNYAVVCNRQAGIINNLHLLLENIEDGQSITTFGLYKKYGTDFVIQ